MQFIRVKERSRSWAATGGSLHPEAGGRGLYVKLNKGSPHPQPTGICLGFLKKKEEKRQQKLICQMSVKLADYLNGLIYPIGFGVYSRVPGRQMVIIKMALVISNGILTRADRLKLNSWAPLHTMIHDHWPVCWIYQGPTPNTRVSGF